jgi:hypothetical protein
MCFRFRNVSRKEDNKQGTFQIKIISRRRKDEEHDSSEAMYDDTTRLLEKGRDSLKWGEVFQMFTIEDDNQVEIFKNIRR